MRSATRGSGFTIVELLVVIAIIGILVAILLPAVNMARESARRSQCGNNMRQIGLAIAGYETQYRRFPPAATTGDESKHSVIAYILPFFEETNVFRQIDFADDWNEGPNRDLMRSVNLNGILICPTAPEIRTQKLGDSTFSDEHINENQVSDYAPANSLNAWTDSADEVFGNFVLRALSRLVGDSISTGRRGIPAEANQAWWGILRKFPMIQSGAIRAAHVRDGLSKTFLFFEVAGRPQHFVNGRPSPAPKRITSFRWGSTSLPISINRTCGGGSVVNCENSDEIYAFHSGGATFVFGDTSVQFLVDQIDPEVFVSFYTMAGSDVADRSRL